MVIREDNNEWNGFPSENQIINDIDRAETNPLIICVGLSMQKIKDRITLIRFFVVTGRQIDSEILRRFGRVETARFHAAGFRKTGKRSDCKSGNW